MKLVIYTHDWLPLVGGIQTFYRALASRLSERSEDNRREHIEVTLVTQTPAKGMDDSQFSFRVVRRPTLRELIGIIRSADVVQVAGSALVPLVVASLCRKPVSVEHHGYQAVCPNGLLVYWPDRQICPGHFMAGSYRQCIRCNSGSQGTAKSMANLMLTFVRRWLADNASINLLPSWHIHRRVSLRRSKVVYHGVPDEISPGGKSCVEKEAKIHQFAFVGRIVWEKGLAVLLQAAHQLQAKGYDFRLTIVGDGLERPRLEKLADDLGLKSRTEFLGWVPNELISSLLADSIAIVMPSIWEDVAPVVAIEHMMQGHLLIVSDVGGLGELVDGVGLKFPVGNATALEACMREVLDRPALSVELGRNAKQYAKKAFTEKRCVEDHCNVYEALISGTQIT